MHIPEQRELFDGDIPIPIETGDICRNRHQGNKRSEEANLRVDKVTDTMRILEYLKTHKTGYLKQIARALGKLPNQISGRFSTLKKNGVIEATGEVAEDCDVYRIVGE